MGGKQARAGGDIRLFDPAGALPPAGVTVLEASAGTGKTDAVASLITRFVAEQVASLPEILAVTFTRLATSELKERVRERLVSSELALRWANEAGRAPQGNDALLAALLARPGPRGGGPEQRRQRLAEALANFDSATITTTHGFCHMVLSTLGVSGQVAPGAVLLEDPHDLVQEVVEDLYARWVRDKGLLPFSPRDALDIGLAALRNLGTPLDLVADRADESPGGLRRRLADATRAEVSRRLIDANLLTYDGMLVRLADALADPVRGQSARRRLTERYRVVLVDEFQDTDLVQWDVVRRAFASGDTRLVLVGDPKQAVYAFRGADVYAYLAAARTASAPNRLNLQRNWRSDGCLATACDALVGHLQLGHPGIVYRRAGPSCARQGPGMRGAPSPTPMRIRWLDRLSCALPSSKPVVKNVALCLVAQDLAADVATLLAAGAELCAPGSSPGNPARGRPLEPRHIGVLVRTNDQALLVQHKLLDAGVAAVVSGSQSVLTTAAASDWLALLDALQQPASRPLLAGAALSAFFGRQAQVLASGDESVWEAVHDRLQHWAGVLRRSGVAAMFYEACAAEKLPQRLLSESQGERRLTDLRHIAELLNSEPASRQVGPAALRAWLARRREEAGTDGIEEDQLCRRLDSDRAAVQVLTVHRAKGLEFPVVYCPYLWDAGHRGTSGKPVAYHDPDDAFRRKLDVGQRGDPGYDRHFALSQEEARGEDLRQMYVALSRAKHQLVLWWAPATDSQRSALGRVLLCKRDADGALAAPNPGLPRDASLKAALEGVAAKAPGLVSIERMGERPQGLCSPLPTTVAPKALVAMPFTRRLDLNWRRYSYTSIVAEPRVGLDKPVGSEPEEVGTNDEPAAGPQLAALALGADGRGDDGAEAYLRSVVSPWASVPPGAAVGTFVHSVLEGTDFFAPDLTKELEGALATRADDYPGRLTDTGALLAALTAVIETPLGSMTGGARLRDIERKDRLDELGFELPLAGGDEPSGEVMMAELGEVFSRHVPPDAPLGRYAAVLEGPTLQTTLRGYLNGSLDLVFRLGGTGDYPGRGDRYFVADYKTNWLAPHGEALSAWHYRPSALEAEMLEANYVLQGLFYLVALHRYLRWRLPGYKPEVHLGGVLYLFVRGMSGPENPTVADGQPCGVFSWEPPAVLVSELSDLLAGPAPARAQ